MTWSISDYDTNETLVDQIENPTHRKTVAKMRELAKNGSSNYYVTEWDYDEETGQDEVVEQMSLDEFMHHHGISETA